MNQYTKEQLAEIHKLATDFTKNTLGDYAPSYMCFTICYPLSLYLQNLGYQNTLVAGHYQNESHIKHGTSHFWLQLNDDLKIIVDPTIGQFENNQFRVHVGEKPEEFKQLSQQFEEWFYNSYDLWRRKLLGIEITNPFAEELAKNEIDIVMLLNINLHAATILNSQSQSKINLHSDIYEKYFDCIFQVIRRYHLKEEWGLIKYKEGFDDLLVKVNFG
ncbi:MAG TPA: hypothetical protein VJ780_10145 [Flavobacterium sp.]|nr:hypothetical protein [Flavobacterium sp.]